MASAEVFAAPFPVSANAALRTPTASKQRTPVDVLHGTHDKHTQTSSCRYMERFN